MKRTTIATRLMSAAFALIMLLGCFGPVSVQAAEATWTIGSDTEIFWVNTDASEQDYDALSEQIRRFSGDLAQKVTLSALPISYGEQSAAGSEDIVLVLDDNAEINSQGYEISVSDASVVITAADAAGLMYGCNSLIRQLLISGSVKSEESAPAVLERGLSLDNGRMYYTVDWIKTMIRELAWENMNTLVLHFSEEMGLGIESKLYPWLAGRDGTLCVGDNIATDDRYLTQKEIADIVAYANSYHVQIIPSFDSPGHMNYIVKKFNQNCSSADYSFTYDGVTYTAKKGSEIGNYFHYNNKTAIVQGSRNTAYSRGIDISNEVAVAFTRSLIEEYGTLFADLGCTAFDIGGDELLGWGASIDSKVSKWKQLDHWKEYAQNRAQAEGNSNWRNAVGYDGFMYYMNDLYDLVSKLGYDSVRMWNDDAFRSKDTGWAGVVNLNKKIEILYWTPTANSSSNNIWTYLNPGHKAYNYLNYYNYYVVGKLSQYPNATAQNIYTAWNPYVYSTPSAGGSNTAIDNPNVLGSAFCIWSDNPSLATEATVMSDTLPMIRAHAAKAWDPNANDNISFTTYKSNIAKTKAAPSGSAGGEIWHVADLSELEAVLDIYNDVDESAYTAESYAVYDAAAKAGQALLEKEKPAQEAVDQAVADIQAAYENLQLLPVADPTALQEAIEAYATVNAEPYTAESFARYTESVENGQQLLQSGVYTQEALDAALLAIQQAYQALELVPVVDTADLEAAIAEFGDMDESLYTEESFDMYAAAVQSAQELLNSGVYTQEQIDSALAAIQTQKDSLRELDSVGETVCFISGSFKSSKVNAGKVATINMSVIKGTDIAGFEVYNDLGTATEIIRSDSNSKQSDRDNYMLMFSPTKELKGNRTYTVYAVLGDGTRSSDCLTLTVTIR